MTTKKKTSEEGCEENRTLREEMEGEAASTVTADAASAGEAIESDRPADDFHDKYLRLMADVQNFRKRSEKERTEVHAFANEKIITQLLGVLDNFERALLQESSDEAPFRDGMTMIAGQFRDVLVREGLEEIKAVGEPFDPRLHHAIMMDASGDAASGHVTEVLQKGYTFKGKLIRPAVVRVAE